MTIEIDDSGTGDLVSGAFIVCWRREMNETVKKYIPLELYQTPEFSNQTKEYAKKCVIEVLSELNIPKTEEIYICTGNIFDEVRKYLQENEYSYQNAKIEGHLQDVVEQTYLDHLHDEYGVPKHILSRESGKKRFFTLLNWVSEDFPRRKEYVKSGFEKWNSKWSEIAHNDWMAKMVKINEKQPYGRSANYRESGQKPARKKFKKSENRPQPAPSSNRSRNHPKPRNYSHNRNDHKQYREDDSAEDKGKHTSTDPDRKKFLF